MPFFFEINSNHLTLRVVFDDEFATFIAIQQ